MTRCAISRPSRSSQKARAASARIPAFRRKNLKEFIALAKAHPGKINYATPGVGTLGHFGTEFLSSLAGIRMTMVPYKGAALYVIDVISGNIDIAFVQIAQAAPLIHQGRLRALGVTATARSALLPEVPTAEEQGGQGFFEL